MANPGLRMRTRFRRRPRSLCLIGACRRAGAAAAPLRAAAEAGAGFGGLSTAVGLAAAPRPRRLRGIAVARAFRYKHSGNLATIGKCSAVIDLSWLWIYTTGNRNSCLITQGENKSPALREEEALQE